MNENACCLCAFPHRKEGTMGSQAGKREEKYVDIEDLLKESLSDKSVTGDKEDMVL